MALQPGRGSRRSRRRPRRPGAGAGRGCPCRRRCWRPTPPRRTTRSSTRNDSEILSQLVGDERVGEPAGEVHQVVGGDRAGDGDLHVAATLPGEHGRRPATSARHVDGRRSPPTGALRVGRISGSESPQAQELPALGLSMVKPCFSMRVGEVDRRAGEVRDAHPVDDDLDAVEVARRRRRRASARRRTAGRRRPEQPPGCTATRRRRSSRPSCSSRPLTLPAATSVRTTPWVSVSAVVCGGLVAGRSSVALLSRCAVPQVGVTHGAAAARVRHRGVSSRGPVPGLGRRRSAAPATRCAGDARGARRRASPPGSASGAPARPSVLGQTA